MAIGILEETFYGYPPCWWKYRAIPFLAVFSLAYSLAVFVFQYLSLDVGLFERMPRIFLRALYLAACIGLSYVLCELNAPDILVTVPITVWTTFGAFYLMLQTRVWDVRGGPLPKFEKFGMRGKVVFVTGANAGVGKETVLQLVAKGAVVILACRSEEKALDAMNEIVQYHFRRTHILIDESQLRFIPMDLNSLESVKAAAQMFLDMKLSLDVLICNAGVLMGNKALSKDGYERMMQVNYLGHFLLINLLLPKLQETPGARIINLSSSQYVHATGGMDVDDLMCEKRRKYSTFGQYGQSKLAINLMTRELAKRHDKIRSYAVHPGVVWTPGIVSNLPPLWQVMNFLISPLLQTLEREVEYGAGTVLLCACATKGLPPNGSFLYDYKVKPLNSQSQDDSAAAKLWKVSEELVGLKKK